MYTTIRYKDGGVCVKLKSLTVFFCIKKLISHHETMAQCTVFSLAIAINKKKNILKIYAQFSNLSNGYSIKHSFPLIMVFSDEFFSNFLSLQWLPLVIELFHWFLALLKTIRYEARFNIPGGYLVHASSEKGPTSWLCYEIENFTSVVA